MQNRPPKVSIAWHTRRSEYRVQENLGSARITLLVRYAQHLVVARVFNGIELELTKLTNWPFNKLFVHALDVYNADLVLRIEISRISVLFISLGRS